MSTTDAKKVNRNIQVVDMSGNVHARKLDYSLTTGESTLTGPTLIETGASKDDWDKMLNKSVWKEDYYCPIDKSQYLTKGFRNHPPNLQPSVHCGIYPVHALTTSDLSDVPKKWTDVEVQWDVQCSMTVEHEFPNHLTQFDRFHYPLEDSYYLGNHLSNTDCFNTNLSTFAGHYTSTKK